jgi:lipoate-protein ligase B
MAEAERRARAEKKFSLLGFEFEPVVTLGLRGTAGRDVLFSGPEIESKGLAVIKVDRGGEATLHSPGQLVIYPVVDLRELGLGVREFVRLLEESVRKTLFFYGINSQPGSCESGVFTERGKIAFVGLRVRQGVVTHGISINVANDLELFRGIRSCGEALRVHDRVTDWRANVEISDVYGRWCDHFMNSLPLTNGARHGLSSAPIGGL